MARLTSSGRIVLCGVAALLAGEVAVPDTVPPRITLLEPANAVLVSSVPSNEPPLAVPGGPYTGTPLRLVTFDGSASHDPDGTIVAYAWDFGDGDTGSGPAPQHAYAEPGMYPVTLTVTDNDGETSTGMSSVTVGNALFINDVTVKEGNAGTRTATFTVTLSPSAFERASVRWTTANDTATAPSDYTAASGFLSFLPGQSAKTLNVTVRGDTTFEPDESFLVVLSQPSGAVLADGQGRGTITNDDAAPLSCPGTVAPGSPFTTTVTVGTSATDWVAQYVPGGPDNPWIGEYRYLPSQRPATLTLTAPESPGTYELRLFANNGYRVIASCSFEVSAVGLSIRDVRVTEGQAGTTEAHFAVILSPPPSDTVTVDFTTADGTATAGPDYVPTSGTLTFAPGETTATITVAVLGDVSVEPTETFVVKLSGASGAPMVDAQGRGTIRDDDTLICPATVPPGSTYTATVRGGASPTDRVAHYAPGTRNNSWIGQRRYVPLPRPSTVAVTAPGTPGTYELRLLANDGVTAIGSCTVEVVP
jgi:large repetitive protein